MDNKNNFKSDFALFIISLIIYGLASNVAITISEKINFPNSIVALFYIILSIILIIDLKRKNKLSYYGFTSLKNLNYKNLLYFLPMIIIVSVNLWNGIHINNSYVQIFLITICMICVGFFEELIFRSFLMKAIMNKNNKLAIIISGTLFGIIHLLNIFTGADILQTIIQVLYATAFGLMCSVFFYKTNNIIPCIICHSLSNAFDIFLPINLSIKLQYLGCISIILISSFYTIYLLKTKKSLIYNFKKEF